MPTSDWPTSVAAVGSVLRARTRDTQGNEVGTFTADTRPTADQVLLLINTAEGDLAASVGADLPDALWAQAAVVASYKAAMLVELSYFPEQVATGRSPYEQLRELYLEALKSLTAAVDAAGGSTPGDSSLVPEEPVYAFPLVSTLDVVLGGAPGGYAVPYSGGLHQ